jgi:hypothetical protein
MQACSKCINGWVEVAENTFNICDCAAGQKLRRFTAVVDTGILGMRPDTGTQPHSITPKGDNAAIERAFEWYKRKMGRVT